MLQTLSLSLFLRLYLAEQLLRDGWKYSQDLPIITIIMYKYI